MTTVALLIPFRKREKQLKSLVHALDQSMRPRGAIAIEVIVIEQGETATAETLIPSGPGWRYIFHKCSGPFHKALLLNMALAQTDATLVCPYDVDLIPIHGALERHICFAKKLQGIAVPTGYRLMGPAVWPGHEMVDDEWLMSCAVAPEDNASALKKHLVKGERFGVLPFFESALLRSIGGWDEAFIGWGAEDQDVMERYIGSGRSFVRSTELTYVHLHHDPSPQWAEDEFVAKNRSHYYSKRKTP
jgi:hypothetical protein